MAMRIYIPISSALWQKINEEARLEAISPNQKIADVLYEKFGADGEDPP